MARTKKRILVVEDGDTEREALARMLRVEQFDVATARNPGEALAAINEPVDLVVSDLRMGQQSGIDLLRMWREQRPYTPFIMITAYGEVGSAVSAMKLGADDFLSKPVNPAQLLQQIRSALDKAAAYGHDGPASVIINEGVGFDKIIGRSRVMVDVCEQTLRAAGTQSTVLIQGESGTGKELIAEAIHRNSPRHEGPFVAVNMAAIPESLVESELFGHVKGAFTSAHSSRVGRFEAARGGTLFIDEIGDFPLSLQAKLLRVLEKRSMSPVGSNEEIPVDVRVVAATSRNLAKMKGTGEFREDLFYRLNVIAIFLPPLREHRQDIAPLARYFLAEFAKASGRKPLGLSRELLRELESLPWPGNVRQLRNCLESMCAMARGDTLTTADLPAAVRESAGEDTEEATPAGSRLESLKRSAMIRALGQFDGNRTRAAEYLGISVRTLQRKLREWDLSDPGTPGSR
jgi:DNA-binding NtrC family response regulator